MIVKKIIFSENGQTLDSKNIDNKNRIKGTLFGIAIGDALGVPVEFISRADLKKRPVKEMIGHGTHNQSIGTWSDDSSLAFCLTEVITSEYDINKIAQNFIKWYYYSYWTARGEVFDIGNSTKIAIERLVAGKKPELAGPVDENSNGNGSLMRIMPLLFCLYGMPVRKRFDMVKDVSSITHGHIRSVIACFYLLEFGSLILEGFNKFEAYNILKSNFSSVLLSFYVSDKEISNLERLLNNNIYDIKENQIKSSGYVIDTLEASIWSILTTNNFRDAVLKAVNLGNDADTTGAVTGGLAGLIYGFRDIPIEWVRSLAKNSEINDLSERMYHRFSPRYAR